MKIDVITLFPEMFAGPFATSMLKKAQDNSLAEINFVNLRDYGLGPRKQVDDTPYGGGDGMVLRADVVIPAIEYARTLMDKELGIRHKGSKPDPKSQIRSTVVLMTPQGQTYNQPLARKLAKAKHLVIVCGHYEGFDERIRSFVDLEVSIGDYVLTGGEIPAMVMVDSVVRLIPGVLGGEQSAADESFSHGKQLEYPQYTRPVEFRGMKVPEVLQTGHHGAIAKWRAREAAKKTRKRAK